VGEKAHADNREDKVDDERILHANIVSTTFLPWS
jgi:hypothetical protein